MSKWIKWNGGYCPVANGTLVDVRYRDGNVTYGVKALESDNPFSRDAGSAFWEKDGQDNDIIAYRLHTKPQSNPITHKALAKLHAKLDRIERKLDLVIGRPLIETVKRDDVKPVAREAWMPGFNIDLAREVLARRYTGYDLVFAFAWSLTDEGEYFWNKEDDNLREGRPLSERARTSLTRMIAKYEAANA